VPLKISHLPQLLYGSKKISLENITSPAASVRLLKKSPALLMEEEEAELQLNVVEEEVARRPAAYVGEAVFVRPPCNAPAPSPPPPMFY
jgi:hypothetical protein